MNFSKCLTIPKSKQFSVHGEATALAELSIKSILRISNFEKLYFLS